SGATVAMFNAPFDLSRLAVGWGRARTRGFEGGFAFTFARYEQEGRQLENRYRPRALVCPLDARRARLGLASARRGAPQMQASGGAAPDLRPAVYALSGESHTLESACVAFGVPHLKRSVEHGRVTPEYVDYCREDVAATAALYHAVAGEYERWRLQLPP